jgi:chromosome transmission fidelity protein 1
LSLICGALTWLRDYKRYVLENGEDNKNGNGMSLCPWVLSLGNEPEWVLEFERQERRVATEMRKREMEGRIARVREKERKDKLAVKKGLGQVTKKRVVSASVSGFIIERASEGG